MVSYFKRSCSEQGHMAMTTWILKVRYVNTTSAININKTSAMHVNKTAAIHVNKTSVIHVNKTKLELST